MLSLNTYFEHYQKQKEFVKSHRDDFYYIGSSEFNDIKRNMKLALLNLCKILLVYNNIPFQEEPEESIITFVGSRQNYSLFVHRVKSEIDLWEGATRRKTSRYYYLDNVVEALENFEKLVVKECRLI